MKKILPYILLSLIIPFFLIKTYPTAYAEGDTEKNENEETIAETLDDILSEIELSEYDLFVDSLEINNKNYEIKELIYDVLNNNFDFDFTFLISYIGNCLIGNVKGLIGDTLIIIVIVILLSILQNLSSDFGKTSIKKIVYIACYAAIITVVVIGIGKIIKTTVETISVVSSFCEIVFPILLTLTTAIGATTTTAIYQPLIIIFSEGIIKIITVLVLPAFYVSLVFNIIGNLSDDLKLSKFASLAGKFGNWVLGIIFGLFITYTTVQGITGSSIDSLAGKSTKFALGNYVPIIGNYLKEGFDIISASCIVIKNSLGFISVIIVLLFSLAPIIKILSAMFVFKLSAAIAEPFGAKKISDMLNGISKSLVLPVLICISMTFTLIVFLMLIIITCNKGVI